MSTSTEINPMNPSTTRRFPVRAVTLAVLAVIAFAIVGQDRAQADVFGFQPNSFTMTTTNARAGAHGDLTTAFALNLAAPATPVATPKNLVVDLPPGVIGDTKAAPTCSIAKVRGGLPPYGCPPNTAVGYAAIDIAFPGFGTSDTMFSMIYNIAPAEGEAAAFAFALAATTVRLGAKVRTGSDYGIRMTSGQISEQLLLLGGTITFWGVPADHTGPGPMRDFAGNYFGDPGPDLRKPFLSNPTSCTGAPLPATLSSTAWVAPETVVTAETSIALMTNCDDLTFDPAMKVRPDNDEAGAPAGYTFDLSVPQSDSPNGLATPHLRKAVVKLPEGVTVSASAANGLQACSDSGVGIGSAGAPSCPDASKIGSVRIETPVLEDPLVGAVYLGEQRPNQLLRMFIVAEGGGVMVKLPGIATPDPKTGQLTLTFDDNPQLPFSLLHIELDGGPQAPLANPEACGTKTTEWDMTPWSSTTATHGTDSFAIACKPGLGGFAPAFSAGSINPTGGAFSPLAIGITKPAGNTDLSGVQMQLPEGLLAHVKGNLGTQVGTVKAFSGPGSSPYMLPGKVFLEGPYGDAPYSLRIVVPAKAGPLDLGEVVVRDKLYVDPIDAHVTVVSDPLPTILMGIPIRLQRLDVNVDKPGFMVNPTSCAAKEIKATLTSVAAQTVPITTRFQVGDCSALALEPRLDMALTGKGETKEGKHPGVEALLSQKPGGANLKKVRVVLPLSLALDPDNAQALCEFADGSKVTPTCPAGSIVGRATAVTPIFDKPLTGPVYFVKNVRYNAKGAPIRTLPKLVVPLEGNGVKLTITGTSAVDDDHLVTTFDLLPDAPVSAFSLSLDGGAHGVLTVTGDKTDICDDSQVADRQIDGQNGKQADADVYIATAGCSVRVLSKKVTANAVTLRIGGLGAGKVTVTGAGVRKTSRTIAKSTVATVVAKRTKGSPGRVTVSFLPKGAKTAKTATARVASR